MGGSAMGSDGTRSDARADLAWLRGVDAYTAGAYVEAADRFRAAVRVDPGMADAWLGLHALKETPSDALVRMFRHRDRFGEQRRHFARPLNSWYWLGWWVQPVLETSSDLLCAYASHWLDGQHPRELDRALALCAAPEDDARARFLHACRGYLRKDWQQLVEWADPLLDDPLLGIEAGLFSGMARVRLELAESAEPVLATALARCRSEVPQRKELRYWLARAYEAMGRGAAALPLYRAVHGRDAAFMDTAERVAVLLAEGNAAGLGEDAVSGPDVALSCDVPTGFPDSSPAGQAGGVEGKDGGDGDAEDVATKDSGTDVETEAGVGAGVDPGEAPPQEDSSALRAPSDQEGTSPRRPSASARAVRAVVPVPPQDAAASPEPERVETILGELDRMVGLEPVKQQIRALSAQSQVARMRSENGLSASPPRRHLMFVGPSGTGKTTVARLLGRVFHALGLLPTEHLVEAHRADLVGEYLGQTALKASQVIDSALGGVLFVDEAYALANSGYSKGDAYGAEALQVLLKRAEDNRDQLVVILAGYPEGMERLLEANPGLWSRFSTQVDFPSYDAQELASIGQAMAADRGDCWDVDAWEELTSVCGYVVQRGWVDRLGNGRFIRTLYETSCAYRDLRLVDQRAQPDRAELTTLRLPDLLQAYGDRVHEME